MLVSGEPGAEQVYLVDFGIARAMAGVGSTRMTRGVVGTFAYMAPERFEEVDGDARADGYALACMLYECLSGRQPFPGESQAQQMRAHFDRPPPRPGDVDPALQAFDGVIAKGMAKRPADRYPTAGARPGQPPPHCPVCRRPRCRRRPARCRRPSIPPDRPLVRRDAGAAC